MRPAIEVLEEANTRSKPVAAAIIKDDRAEVRAELVAEIVADLRTNHGSWNQVSDYGKYFADHIEAKFGGTNG